jgi:hypothetical protein
MGAMDDMLRRLRDLAEPADEPWSYTELASHLKEMQELFVQFDGVLSKADSIPQAWLAERRDPVLRATTAQVYGEGVAKGVYRLPDALQLAFDEGVAAGIAKASPAIAIDVESAIRDGEDDGQ